MEDGYLGCYTRVGCIVMMPPRGTYSVKVTRHDCRRGAPAPLFSREEVNLAAMA